MASCHDVVRVDTVSDATDHAAFIGKDEWNSVLSADVIQENGPETASRWAFFAHSSCRITSAMVFLSDFTIVHIAQSHDGSLHLIKMHKDREPIVMPLAPKAKVAF